MTLDGLTDLESLDWSGCSDDWQAPLRPPGKGAYFDWPRATQLFPFHTAGAVFYRGWPISESSAVLSKRWEKLVSSEPEKRKALFKQSRDRKVKYEVRDARLPGYGKPSVGDAVQDTPEPSAIRYGFRTLDRQFAFYDFRLGDFLRPGLNYLATDQQTFLVIPDSLVTSFGPAAVVTSLLPDQHHFRGSFGGKDVIPLYKDPEGTEPNLTTGLLDMLGNTYGTTPSVEDVACYVLAVLGCGAYTSRFWNELEIPGPRVPITKDVELFTTCVDVGRKLAWLQTYGERFHEPFGKDIPTGTAKSVEPVSSKADMYPAAFSYSAEQKQITVGDGTFGPVEPEVWAYQVSGFPVVSSWLSYRMKKRAGRKSSELDEIRPERWTPAFTSEFLELLWVVEQLVSLDPELSALLEKVVAGECFTESELPFPQSDDKKVKVPAGDAGGLLSLMGDEAAEDDDDDEEDAETEEDGD